MDPYDMPRHRPLAFDKMEVLIKEMQDPETGVPVRCQKLFLSVIPSAFMGYDLVEWLMDRFNLDEANNVEAINLANQLCQYGYYFPVNDLKNLILKDDSSLYRFQSPYYWPWQTSRVAGSGSSAPSLGPDNIEYAIYLVKRTLRNKQRHALEDYEQEALANLKKNLAAKWDFITMQAEEQVRLAKDRKKGDKIVSDSQERAYWRVARPPPGVPSALEPCPVPVRTKNPRARKRTVDQLQKEIDILRTSLDRTRVKSSIALEALLGYSETFAPYDPWLTPPQPSNPWITDDTLFWQINSPLVEIPSEKRVQRWALSIEELVNDPTGLQEFTSFLRKEYSHENIRFWLAVMDLRRSSTKSIPTKLQEIYEEFLKPGAPCEINIDGATAEKVAEGLRTGSRYALDHAADHVYGLLLKKDCYPRFVRSDHFRRLLDEGRNVHQKKAKFFNFGGGQVKKKPGSTSGGATGTGTGTSVPAASMCRRRGSERSLCGSAHELAVSGAQPPRPAPPPAPTHSHSHSNLHDISFRDPLDDSTDDTLPWDSSSRDSSSRRRQDSAADSGSSSSDVSAITGLSERTRRLPQQSTLDGGLRGAPPPLRRLSAVEPRHLAPLSSPPHSPRCPRTSHTPATTPAPTTTTTTTPAKNVAAPPHPTPTISVSSAPDDESPSGTTSPERRSLAISDEPSSVFASAAATPTEPARPIVARRASSLEKTISISDSRTDIKVVSVKKMDSESKLSEPTICEPASSKDSYIGELPRRKSNEDCVPPAAGVNQTEKKMELSPEVPPSSQTSKESLTELKLTPSEKVDVTEEAVITSSVPGVRPAEPTPTTSSVPDVSVASSSSSGRVVAPLAEIEDTNEDDEREKVPVDPRSELTAAAETRPKLTASTDMGPKMTATADRRPEMSAPVNTRLAITAPIDTRPAITAPVDTRPAITAPVETRPELTAPADARGDSKSELEARKPRNDICPWEDENSCESDAPFVKTYATLGYL